MTELQKAEDRAFTNIYRDFEKGLDFQLWATTAVTRKRILPCARSCTRLECVTLLPCCPFHHQRVQRYQLICFLQMFPVALFQDCPPAALPDHRPERE